MCSTWNTIYCDHIGTTQLKVYFITTRWTFRRCPWRAAWRRYKAGRPSLAYSLLVQWLTLSPFVHCAVGDGEVVMEVRPDGIRFWPDLAYSLGRGVSWVYEVPTTNPIEWSRWEHDIKPRGPLPSLAYLFTGGRVHTSNCVTETKAVLAMAGVDVPRKVLTPAHLWDWLREQGYELSSVDGSA